MEKNCSKFFNSSDIEEKIIKQINTLKPFDMQTSQLGRIVYHEILIIIAFRIPTFWDVQLIAGIYPWIFKENGQITWI